MQIDTLSSNGIDELLKGSSAFVQIIEAKTIEKNNMSFTQCVISDGFAKLSKCYFNEGHGNEKELMLAVAEIQLTVSEKHRKRLENGKNPSFVVEGNPFQILLHDLKKVIGQPLDYVEFVKRQRKNPKGSNKIIREEQLTDNSDEDFKEAVQATKKQNPLVKDDKSSTYSLSLGKPPQVKEKPKQLPNYKNNSLDVKDQNASKKQKKIGPIEKISENTNSRRPSIKASISNQNGEFQSIKQLYNGIQNFKLKARLLFSWPIKTITNKKGTQTELLNLQFGDSSGTILGTAFGENAVKFASLQPDKIFIISSAYVSETIFKGVKQLKLSFHETTKMLQTEDKSIPSIEKFCMNLKDLTEAPVGSKNTVLCFVREGEYSKFISKQNREIKKKVLHLFDIENKIEVQMTLLMEKADDEFPTDVYALKDVQIDEFQGLKQYKGGLLFTARPLKHHYYNNYKSDLDDTNFQNASMLPPSGKSKNITSFMDLLQKSKNLTDTKGTVWSDVVCRIRGLKLNLNKGTYLSCPTCKKKVHEEFDHACESCHEKYERAKYRYILNVNLVDGEEQIWVSAYDAIGEKLLAIEGEDALTADAFMRMTEDELSARIKQIRYREVRLKILSCMEEYKEELRLKHKIIKILPLNYGQQAEKLLSWVKANMQR